ncbi:hypothetical protein [Accumulibacter sp.]|uniref:hypothetical protein n=1 Tax=Accumulibacter sp. TaxID=2053492 RepID=UPI001A5E9926|nr:hypothetical protein [Accumulibacter sp.]MBL8373087.1 hypothetical protein [Accumulibacter sp.]
MHALALPGGQNDDIHEIKLGQTVRLVLLVFLPLSRTAASRQGMAGERADTGFVRRRTGAEFPFPLFNYFRSGGKKPTTMSRLATLLADKAIRAA